MTDKKKIAIVGVGSPSIEVAMAALQYKDLQVVVVQATDAMKEATESFQKATISNERLNKALDELKAIPALEFEKATMNKPFYHNLPQKKHKRKKK